MDAKTCLKKMQLVGVLNVATVDENGAPQIRCISAVHYDEDSFYFFHCQRQKCCRRAFIRRTCSDTRLYKIQGDDPSFRKGLSRFGGTSKGLY